MQRWRAEEVGKNTTTYGRPILDAPKTEERDLGEVAGVEAARLRGAMQEAIIQEWRVW